MKTLYVSDLDGTLLNRQSRLSAYTVETLNCLIGEGLPFTYATARSVHSARIVAAGCTRSSRLSPTTAHLCRMQNRERCSPAFPSRGRNWRCWRGSYPAFR